MITLSGGNIPSITKREIVAALEIIGHCQLPIDPNMARLLGWCARAIQRQGIAGANGEQIDKATAAQIVSRLATIKIDASFYDPVVEAHVLPPSVLDEYDYKCVKDPLAL